MAIDWYSVEVYDSKKEHPAEGDEQEVYADPMRGGSFGRYWVIERGSVGSVVVNGVYSRDKHLTTELDFMRALAFSPVREMLGYKNKLPLKSSVERGGV